ncbi:MAG: VOC family protein [Betaproteobacteria bacterium]|nr:VOC family protein [Betaproteobacteria bacterium]
MPIGKLDHYSIRTPDTEASRRFYTDVMGFQVGFRPPFDFPGLWLYNGAPYPESCGVVHIIGIDLEDPQGLKAYLGDRDPDSLSGTGTVDHVAFNATGLADMRARLQRHEVAFRERTVPALGLHQVFFEDPSGVTIELNFPAAEARRAA